MLARRLIPLWLNIRHDVPSFSRISHFSLSPTVRVAISQGGPHLEVWTFRGHRAEITLVFRA